MYRIEILRILPGEAEQPGWLIDKHQVIVLIEDLYLLMTRRGNKGIENRRHQAAGWGVDVDNNEFSAGWRIWLLA